MTTKKDILKRELARNVVRFGTHKNSKDQSVCNITIGGIEHIRTFVLDGEEKQVLEHMATKYWSIDTSIGNN